MRAHMIGLVACIAMGGCSADHGETAGSPAVRPGAIVRVGPPGAVVEVLVYAGAGDARVEGPSRAAISVDPARPGRFDLTGDGKLVYGATSFVLRGSTLTVEAALLVERPRELSARRVLSTDGYRVEAPPR